MIDFDAMTEQELRRAVLLVEEGRTREQIEHALARARHGRLPPRFGPPNWARSMAELNRRLAALAAGEETGEPQCLF